jgi:hypothetical protein
MLRLRYLPALVAAAMLMTEAAHGQDIRKMTFSLGGRQNDLRVEIAYHDPADIDKRLAGSRLLPIRLSVTNVSSQPISLDYADIRLTLNGTQTLSAVDAAAVASEIRRMNGRFPKLLDFLASQSSTFHRTELEKKRLQDGRIQPRRKKEGYVFFMRPAQGDGPFNGLMWLETGAYSPQALETKAISVTRAPEPSTLNRIQQILHTVISGELPYQNSYALLVGIGKYRNWDPLWSPGQDVMKMRDFLLAQGFNEIWVVEDDDVTVDTLQNPQKYFKPKIQADDRFLFYYTGHGMSIPEGGKVRGYFPLVNETRTGHSNSVAMDAVVSWMKQLSSKQLLIILDSCFSGLAVAGSDSPSRDQGSMKNAISEPARYLLMAGTDNQVSIANPKWKGSLFTEMIIRGVRTAQFADARDSIIAIHALYAWVRPAVSNEAGGKLTPLLKDLANVSTGEFFFVRTP